MIEPVVLQLADMKKMRYSAANSISADQIIKAAGLIKIIIKTKKTKKKTTKFKFTQAQRHFSLYRE